MGLPSAVATLTPVHTNKSAGQSRMSPRERWLAALAGEAVDCLPFWAKLDASYLPYQGAPWRDRLVAEVHAYVGSTPPIWIASAVERGSSTCGFVRSEQAGRAVEIYDTPAGPRRRESGFDPVSRSWHPLTFPVLGPADLAPLSAWFEAQRPELNAAALETARQRAAQAQSEHTGVTCCTIGISPLMEFVQHFAALDQAHYLLNDNAPAVEQLLEAMGRVILRKAELIAATTPADFVFMVENTSTTLISPRQYRRYCLPILREIAKMLHAHGKRLCLHMCGFLRKILPDLATVGADAFEATTSPPVGDTRLLDARTHCPAVTIVGGTNANLWTRPAEAIIAELRDDLDALPHHRRLVVSSAGVMPPLCSPDTIRQVSEFVRQYPVRM